MTGPAPVSEPSAPCTLTVAPFMISSVPVEMAPAVWRLRVLPWLTMVPPV